MPGFPGPGTHLVAFVRRGQVEIEDDACLVTAPHPCSDGPQDFGDPLVHQWGTAGDRPGWGLGGASLSSDKWSSARLLWGPWPGEKMWPRFGPRVGRLGVHSALSLPLLLPGQVVGAINVYARGKAAFDDHATHLGE